MGLLQVPACGFRPLYSGEATEKAVSGERLTEETSSIFIDEISERTGQILRQVLSDRLTPQGEPDNPRYRLSVGISRISISEQAVRRDNLATRYLMTMTVKYILYSYPENKKLMSGSFAGRSNYDVQRSPYATDMAEEKTKERLAKIMGDDVALRVAAFLKGYKDPRLVKTKENPDKEADANQEETDEKAGAEDASAEESDTSVSTESEAVQEESEQVEEQLWQN